MKCPVCQEKAIRFSQWKKAVHAFNWICPHCRAGLRANWLVNSTCWLAWILCPGLGGYAMLTNLETPLVGFFHCMWSSSAWAGHWPPLPGFSGHICPPAISMTHRTKTKTMNPILTLNTPPIPRND